MSLEDLQIYLVGGAVRDELLGLPVKEKDWVVVGATPQLMLDHDFTAVGKDFPVFLHPQTHEEYALARSERKVGKGYTGFVFHADPNVTLEQDLKRRDLTINAIAKDKDGHLIDPFGGQQDLNQRLLKHVSEAFAEDPVRILRIARFAAKLPNFHVHSKTNELIKKMAGNGEVNALVAERVWKELSRALGEKAPLRFFEVLAAGEALEALFPEIQLQGQGCNLLKKAAQKSSSTLIRFAVLLHDLPVEQVSTLCKRLRIPKEFTELAKLSAKQLKNFKTLDKKDPLALLHFLQQTDALRREPRFNQLLEILDICCPKENERINALNNALSAIKNTDTHSLQQQQLKGKNFANALEKLQIDNIKKRL